MGIWNEKGEAYMKSNGEIISINQAQREGRQTRSPFDNGSAKLKNGFLYPDDED